MACERAACVLESPQMPMTRRCRPVLLFATLGVLIAWEPLSAHPGHAVPVDALPTWRTVDGRVLAATFVTARNGRALFADAADHPHVVAVADLDADGRQSVERATARARLLNGSSPEQFPAAPVGATTAEAPPAAAMPAVQVIAAAPGADAGAPAAAAAFRPFARVKTRWDERFLYVESDGLPDHPMMTGIRSWQQQVPLPQPYAGDNAWRLPLAPVPAKASRPVKDRFLRGAIALAVNGVPIFNPQNNRGELAQEIGELDAWGGHCGRADDYHYHAAPLHLQAAVGKAMPVAYALDGYPMYGLAEPDGSPTGPLDECHGHATAALGYHYHAAERYPYVMAGFHGEVVERDGQVDPQPRAAPTRPALPPLRGATITAFETVAGGKRELTYEVGGRRSFVRYGPAAGGGFVFAFGDAGGEVREQTFQRRDEGRGSGREEGRPPRGGPADDARRAPTAPAADAGAKAGAPAPAATPVPGAQPATAAKPAAVAKHDSAPDHPASGFALTSPAVAPGTNLPTEFSGDGAGVSPPLEWRGAPAGTKSYAVVMHHVPGPGDVKWYWVLYDLPASAQSLPKDARGVGTLGTNSVNGRPAYAPPHSKGPGAKTYVLTVYALSAPPTWAVPPARVDRETLLAAIRDKTLATAELTVVYDRTAAIAAGGGGGGGGGGGPAEPGLDRRPGPGPDNRPPPDGPPAEAGRGGAVHLIPRGVEERLALTADQRDRIAALDREADERLARILTPEQIKTLREARPPKRD
jgi:phosphatidylethanolamine-binding protein (PEBP) family uncharacterized protein